MKYRELGLFKLLKLKYSSGEQIIQSFYRIGYFKKLGSLSLTGGNLKKTEKKSAKSHRMH